MPKIIKLGDGTVYQYGKSKPRKWRWQLWVLENPKDPNSPLRRVTKGGFAKKSEANDSLQEARLKAKKHQLFIQVELTLGAFAQEWLDQQAQQLSPSTVYGYKKILRNHIEPHLGKFKLQEVTRERITHFYREISASGRKDEKNPGGPLSPNTVNKIHIVLQAILKAAVKEEKLSSTPIADAKSVGAPTSRKIRSIRKEIIVWNREELLWFLSWSRHERKDDLYMFWTLLAFTGLRRGEAVALKWKDVNFEGRSLHVVRAADPVVSKTTKRTKTGRDRTVSLDRYLLEELRDWRRLREQLGESFVSPESWVFGTLKNELRTPNDLSARFARAVKAAQAVNPRLPWLTMHGLRHTHATQLLSRGKRSVIVQERLGHSAISTTLDIYQHVTQNIQTEAIDDFAEWLLGEKDL